MKKRKKTTISPEQWAKWRANHERLERIIERRLAQEGATRAEAIERLSNPRS